MKYKEGDIVGFNTGVIVGEGKVVGMVSNNPFGIVYIVSPLWSRPELPNESYPYSHLCIIEHHIHTYVRLIQDATKEQDSDYEFAIKEGLI